MGHDADVVPFLSVDSVRRFFAALRVIEGLHLRTWIRTLIIVWGSTDVVSPMALTQVENALRGGVDNPPLPTKKGAPQLLIPASTNVWMRSKSNDLPRDLGIPQLKEFNHFLPSDFVLVADSIKLAKLGINLDPLMITSHFPN